MSASILLWEVHKAIPELSRGEMMKIGAKWLLKNEVRSSHNFYLGFLKAKSDDFKISSASLLYNGIRSRAATDIGFQLFTIQLREP